MLAQITLACAVADGSVTQIAFVPIADTDFGSTFFATGGVEKPTVLGPAITVKCGPIG